MSSLYLDRPSPVHRLNPTTKLVGVVSIIILVFAVSYWWAPFAILILLVVPAALLARVGGRLAIVGGAILVPLLLVVTIGQGFFNRAGETVLFALGPFEFKLEGVLFADHTRALLSTDEDTTAATERDADATWWRTIKLGSRDLADHLRAG